MSFKEDGFEWHGDGDEYGENRNSGAHDATITATHGGAGNFDIVETNQLARGLKSRHIQYRIDHEGKSSSH